jgi:hypothetical protein
LFLLTNSQTQPSNLWNQPLLKSKPEIQPSQKQQPNPKAEDVVVARKTPLQQQREQKQTHSKTVNLLHKQPAQRRFIGSI